MQDHCVTRVRSVNYRATRWLRLLALAGSLGCSTASTVRWQPDDGHVDAVWAALQRGELDRAAQAAARIEDVTLRTRAELDVRAARDGRAAAYLAARGTDSWLAARFAASDEH